MPPDPSKPDIQKAHWSDRVAAWGEVQAERPWFKKTLAFYHRNERFAPSLFFFGGVTWDALTLQRIDAWFDNVFLLAYLILLGALIIVAALVEYECIVDSKLCRFRTWYPPAIQFFLGALFSAYVIFYFQSVSPAPTTVFFGLLVALLVANEFIHRRLVNLYLLLLLYFFACVSFFIFFIPVVTKTLNYETFLAGGVVSVVVTAGIVFFLAVQRVFSRFREGVFALALVGVFFLLLNVFYLQNWIPPVPLAMRHGGVFHHVTRTDDGFLLQFEQPKWYQFWIDSDTRFHRREGEPVYCFTAIFAPTELKKKVYHEWSVYDTEKQEWVITDRIGYDVTGGRFQGFRGYTVKRNIWPGQWRVDVETEAGRIIGRIRFRVEQTAAPLTDLKEVVYE